MILSCRQEQMMALLARGLTHKQIAAELGIGPSTVRTHIHNALRVNGYSNSTQIVVCYQRERMLSPAAIQDAVVALRSAVGSPEERMRAALQAVLHPPATDPAADRR